jgi:amidase
LHEELYGYDALGLAALVTAGELSALELLEATIGNIERLNPRLNAIVHRLDGRARDAVAGSAPAGVFGAVPFLVKDLIAEVEGTPFCEGSRGLKDYVSKLDTELVRRQKAAGLVIVGKTNAAEFGLYPSTEPALYGAAKNPWNVGLTTGGSSGGSAAAVAAGIVPMAHANDAGGSIRIPASCCGVFGLKPTRARNPLGPLFGEFAGGLVHEHAVTRSVRDSAALLDATCGADAGDPYFAPPAERSFLDEVQRDPGRLKIGLLTAVPPGWHPQAELHPDCERAVRDAAALCEAHGHIVEEVDPTRLAEPELGSIYGRVFTAFAAHVFEYWHKELGRELREEDVEPLTWRLYQAGSRLSSGQYLHAVQEMHLFCRKIARWYQEGGYDLLLTPTLRIAPVPLGAFSPTEEDPHAWLDHTTSFAAFTRIQNMTGQPAMSVPLFWNDDDVPIGVQFAARFGDEATLFRLAAQLERARPWSKRTPRVHCRTA